jgi:hypothetical protein
MPTSCVVPSGGPWFGRLLRGGIWKLKLERIVSGMCRTENKAVNIPLLNSGFGTRKQLPIKMIFSICASVQGPIEFLSKANTREFDQLDRDF